MSETVNYTSDVERVFLCFNVFVEAQNMFRFYSKICFNNYGLASFLRRSTYNKRVRRRDPDAQHDMQLSLHCLRLRSSTGIL